MKASIIIPIYNAEKTLAIAIKSIIAQTETDFEVLLIDDCSKDGSFAICMEAERNDSRFHYVRMPHNFGPAATRNAGIDLAKGDYLLFIDSDDTVQPDFVKRMISTATLNQADIVWCNFRYKYYDTGVQVNTDHGLNGLLDFKSYISCYVRNSTGTGCLWNKAYRRGFIEQYSLRINEHRVYGEDWDFNFRLGLCAPKVVVIPEVLYNYIQYGTSVSRMYHSADFESYCESHTMMIEVIRQYEIEIPIIELECRFVYNIVSLLYKLMHSSLSKVKKKNEFERICNSDLFQKVLANTSWNNSALTMRQKFTIAIIRLRLNRIAQMVLSK